MSATIKPLTFRLPKPGQSDPHFGFSRSYYYDLEKRGVLRLIRFLDERIAGKPRKNKQRGVTAVPFDQVERWVRKQIEEQSGGVEDQLRVRASGKAQSEQMQDEESEQTAGNR